MVRNCFFSFFFTCLLPTQPIQLLAQVKTFEEVTGHQIGDRITLSHQILDYLYYLEEGIRQGCFAGNRHHVRSPDADSCHPYITGKSCPA
jgi:hypothetical protein